MQRTNLNPFDVFLTHEREIRAIARKIVGRVHGADEAEEVVGKIQDYMPKVIAAYNPERGSITPLVKRMAANQCKNHLALTENASRKLGRKNEDGETVEAVDALACEAPTPFEAALRSSMRDAMERAIQTLTDRQQALLAAYFDCGKWSEASRSIGISPAMGSIEKARIIEHLRGKLDA